MRILERSRLNVDVLLVESEEIVIVEFVEISTAEVCAFFCLLNEGMIQCVAVAGTRMVKFCSADDGNQGLHGRISISDKLLTLELSKLEIEYILTFFLTLFRDEYSEVDHIDLDLISKSADVSSVQVVIKVGDDTNPISAG